MMQMKCPVCGAPKNMFEKKSGSREGGDKRDETS